MKNLNKNRGWYWQIEEAGQGPDCNFIATFDESDAGHLVEVVEQNLPSCYVRNLEFTVPARRGDCAVYRSYLDRHTYERLLGMEASGEKENIYYNGEIEIRDHQFQIENILSCGMYDETDLVIALAKAPGLSLRNWTVAYSGYSRGEVARGSTASELLAYLQHEV